MEADGAAAAEAKPLTPEEEALRRNTDCVYFLASPLTCKKGNQCDFRHSENARTNPTGCYHWLNGNCLNPKCSFRHLPIDDDFSRFPDELLLQILRFTSAKEGAVTTALSKRWRPLWTSSGAINLEARILEDDEQRMMEEDVFFKRRDKFVLDAHKALNAFTNAPVPITTLTFRIEGHTANIIRDFLNREANWRGRPQVLARILAHPAASAVEELRITAVDNITGEPMLFEKINYEVKWSTYGTRMYSINLHSLSSGTLRELDLTNCGELALGLSPPVFPHLWKLRLRHCELLIPELQSFVNSAPVLSSIHLESMLLEDDRILPNMEGDVPPPLVRSLNCPAATILVIYKCCLKEEGTLQIFAPMLQRFEYKGVLRRIVLSPTPQDLLRVDITLTEYHRKQDRDTTAARQSFWGFLQGFIHIKRLTLRIRLVKGVNLSGRGVLPVLHNIEHLELSLVFCSPTDKKATILIANLLSCCPKLRNLRFNLTTVKEDSLRGHEYSHTSLKRKFDKDLQESVRRSKRLEMQPEVAAGERHYFDEVSELSELSGRQFDCLNGSLKKVALQFVHGEKVSLGDKLVKFFAENAKVLEEMYVDAGNARLGDHLNHKIKNWIASWPEEKKFNILPLQRQN